MEHERLRRPFLLRSRTCTILYRLFIVFASSSPTPHSLMHDEMERELIPPRTWVSVTPTGKGACRYQYRIRFSVVCRSSQKLEGASASNRFSFVTLCEDLDLQFFPFYDFSHVLFCSLRWSAFQADSFYVSFFDNGGGKLYSWQRKASSKNITSFILAAGAAFGGTASSRAREEHRNSQFLIWQWRP